MLLQASLSKMNCLRLFSLNFVCLAANFRDRKGRVDGNEARIIANRTERNGKTGAMKFKWENRETANGEKS